MKKAINIIIIASLVLYTALAITLFILAAKAPRGSGQELKLVSAAFPWAFYTGASYLCALYVLGKLGRATEKSALSLPAVLCLLFCSRVAGVLLFLIKEEELVQPAQPDSLPGAGELPEDEGDVGGVDSTAAPDEPELFE